MHQDTVSEYLRKNAELRNSVKSTLATGIPHQEVAERKERTFDMWLACHTQEEIAETVGIPQQTLIGLLPKMEELPNSVKGQPSRAREVRRKTIPIWYSFRASPHTRARCDGSIW